MAIYTLSAYERKLIKVTSRFLNVLSVGGALDIESPQFDLKPIRVKSGWQLDLNGINEVYLYNAENAENIVEAQDAGIPISLGGGGGVTVENKPVIQRIEESIQVEAQATVDGGTVAIVARDVSNAITKKTIEPGQRLRIVDARNAIDRKITLQLITENTQRSKVYIGADQSISDDRGLVLFGNIDSIASMSISNQSAVWAYNASNFDAHIIGVEEYSTASPVATNLTDEINNLLNNGLFSELESSGVPTGFDVSDVSAVSVAASNLGAGQTVTISSQGLD